MQHDMTPQSASIAASSLMLVWCVWDFNHLTKSRFLRQRHVKNSQLLKMTPTFEGPAFCIIMLLAALRNLSDWSQTWNQAYFRGLP